NLVVDLLKAGGDGTTNYSVTATRGDLLVASEFTEPSGRDHLVGIQAGDGDVNLAAEAGSIDEVRDADAVEIRTGGTVTLSAAERVGGSGNSAALDVEAAGLTGSAGGPFVVRDHAGDLLLGNVTTQDGEIDIETLGTLTVPDGSTISTTQPNDVTLTGAAIELNNGGIEGTARQAYNGPVTLGADTTLAGTDILFNATVQSDGTPRDLVINSSGNGITRFSGDVGGDGNVLRRLITNADGTTEIGGNIDTAGRMQFGDAVVLIGDDIMLVDMGTGRDAGVYFGSTIDSDGTARGLFVQVNTADMTDAPEVPLISFAGDVGVGSPLKYLRLNTKSPRSDVPAVATIVVATRKADGTIDLGTPIDFNVRVLEDFRVGPNEKLTILGDWTLDAGLGGPSVIELGDVNAGGLVTINANGSTVEFLERSTGEVLLPGDGNGNGLLDDFLSDLGVDVVVRDGFVLNDGIILNSPGGPGAPRFAALDPSTVTGSGLEDFTVLKLTDGFPPLVRIGADGRIIVLDLAAPMPTSPAAAQLATAFPDTPEFEDRIRIPLARIEHLLEMQIAVRPAQREELLRRTDGNATYNDVDLARAEGRVVTINRIREQVVLDALATYRNLFFREQTDAEGQVSRTSRLEQWQEVLAASYDRFQKAAGPDALDATAFRAFVENTPDEQDALDLLNGLRDLYGKFAQLGLTAPELAQAPDTIARRLGGGRIAPVLLNRAVMALPAASSSE
ncbi:MAG: hypothetical protein OER86_10495, partial [Phycisphaerae bacterium]|nr:hypothetical protein [Phycisphaerae bacterium]